MLTTMPITTLAGCAFDAFVHFFETAIAKHERSRFGEMLSLDGMPRIMRALEEVVSTNSRDGDALADLMYSATMAGVAISNVRTGNIHEAAGALLELTELSHPETLFVFFREAVGQYLVEIRDQEEQLVARLWMIPAFEHFATMEDIISWWEQIFVTVGLDSRIRASVVKLKPSMDKARVHIFQRVYSDKVWITKECPLILDEISIRDFIDRSLDRFLT
jgi:alcohol dehydrogenase class IV